MFARLQIIGLIVLCLTAPALADRKALLKSLPKIHKTTFRQPVLVEIGNQLNLAGLMEQAPYVEKIPSLLPNRIYRHFNETTQEWDWVLTNRYGELPEPHEAFRIYSVVSGGWLGVKESNQNYILDPEAKSWIKTFRSEQYFYTFFSNPPERPKMKLVLFDPFANRTSPATLSIPSKLSQRGPKLYDLQKGTFTDVNGRELLSQRIYAVYVADRNEWSFALTDLKGALPEPIEIFCEKSVLPGLYLGARDPSVAYELNGQGKWINTKQREDTSVLILSQPEKKKRTLFQTIRE